MIDLPTFRLWIHEDKNILVENQIGLTDYKFYCFDGKPKFLYVSYNSAEHGNSSLVFLDMNYQRLPFDRPDYLHMDTDPIKPDTYDQMVQIAKQLSNGVKFLRVDMYSIENNIYFSECTFYPCDGFMQFQPEEYDRTIGELLDLKKELS